MDEYREAITTFLLAEAQSRLDTPGHHIVGSDDRDQLNGAKSLHQQFFMAIGQLQTLIVESGYSVPPLVIPSDKKLIPMPFFTGSLKKLFVGRWTPDLSSENLTSKNALWLLLWCPQLQEASLSFTIWRQDVEFLAEHREAFAGLSNVKEVALDFHTGFKENKKKTWWGQSAELEKDWRGGSAKTQLVIDLLAVTRDLKSLELSQLGGETQEGDRTIVFSSCLLGARSSSESLQNLRIIGIAGDQNNITATPYHLFKNLKVLVLHQVALLYLSAFPEMRLPSSLQIFVSPYYSWFPSSEDAVTWYKGDLDVADIVSSRFLPNLRVVIVPAEPINERGEIIESVEFRKEWVQRRKELESLKIFKSGRVELRKLTLKQMGE